MASDIVSGFVVLYHSVLAELIHREVVDGKKAIVLWQHYQEMSRVGCVSDPHVWFAVPQNDPVRRKSVWGVVRVGFLHHGARHKETVR